PGPVRRLRRLVDPRNSHRPGAQRRHRPDHHPAHPDPAHHPAQHSPNRQLGPAGGSRHRDPRLRRRYRHTHQHRP
ncbi:hypothetical protein DSJ13_01895, partial [Mycobacterium tuberculosis]